MRAACVAEFPEEIKNGRVDAFFVRTAKAQTVDQKKVLVGKSCARSNALEKANPSLTEKQIKVLIMKTEVAEATAIGQWFNRWCELPLPTMSEPAKPTWWLTNRGTYPPDIGHPFIETQMWPGLIASSKGFDAVSIHWEGALEQRVKAVVFGMAAAHTTLS